jgi:hypothetical protein
MLPPLPQYPQFQQQGMPAQNELPSYPGQYPGQYYPEQPMQEMIPSPSAMPQGYPQAMPQQGQPQSALGPVFVKITKFKEAKKDFERIKANISEFQKTFSQVKDVKAKEDEEMYQLEQDLEDLKDRLSKIDAELFEQI